MTDSRVTALVSVVPAIGVWLYFGASWIAGSDQLAWAVATRSLGVLLVGAVGVALAFDLWMTRTRAARAADARRSDPLARPTNSQALRMSGWMLIIAAVCGCAALVSGL